jgi:hypothetical protein
MRQLWIVMTLMLLAGCQMPAGRTNTSSAHQSDAVARLEAALPGEYDNDAQVRQAYAAVSAGTQIAIPHLREQLRLLEQDRDHSLWLWRLQIAQTPDTSAAMWVYRISNASDGKRVVLTPYRAIDPSLTAADLSDPKKPFKFVPMQWAVLDPCALSGEWKNAQFIASADATACSALLPGLGASASLLPLRLTLDGDMLHAATFADQARGADASIDARRLRWFSGWAALNGGGPKARPENQDWHMQKDMHLSSEGGRVPLRWRDGAPSGFSLELVRVNYAERKLNVLQLNVIDDASGRTLNYAWTNPEATALGINLGWLQVGLTQATE